MVPVDLSVSLVERRDGFALRLDDLAHSLHTRARKQEILRVHVASLNEAAGLLGAPARVGLIDESALVVHEAVEVPAGTGQALAVVLTADLEQLAAADIGPLKDLAEDIDQALLAIETEEHARRAADSGFLHQELHIGPHGALIGRIEVRGIRQTVTVAAEAQRRWFQASTLGVQHVTDDDAVEPGPEGAASLEGEEVGESLDQDLLGGILGVLRVVEHSDRDVVDPGLMAPHEVFERVAVAGSSSGHEEAVFWIGVGGVGQRARAVHGSIRLDTIRGRM